MSGIAKTHNKTAMLSKEATDLPSSDDMNELLPGRYILARQGATKPEIHTPEKEQVILQPGRYHERPPMSSPETPHTRTMSRYNARPVQSPSSSVFSNGRPSKVHRRGRYYKPDRALLSSTPPIKPRAFLLPATPISSTSKKSPSPCNDGGSSISSDNTPNSVSSDDPFQDTQAKSPHRDITVSPHSIPKCVKDFILHDMHRDGSKTFTPPIEASRVDVRHVNHVGRSALLKEEQDPTLFSMDKFVCDSRTNLAYDYHFTEENLYQIHHIAKPDLDEWDGEIYEARLDIMQEGRRNQLRMETYYSDIFDRLDKKLEEGEHILKSVIDIL